MIYEIGKRYRVPCARLVDKATGKPNREHPLADRNGWVPTMGPAHEDAEIIGFAATHFHVDVRFAPDALLDRLRVWSVNGGYSAASNALDRPFSFAHPEIRSFGRLRAEFSVRLRTCRREMPVFPVKRAKYMRALESEYRGCKLKPGRICPHRGISVDSALQPDGTFVCPGHGLRWSADGDLILTPPTATA